jgi:hypothetical protein
VFLRNFQPTSLPFFSLRCGQHDLSERLPVCPIIQHPLQNVYLSAQLYSIPSRTFTCLPNYTASPPERLPVFPIIQHPLQSVFLSAQLYSIPSRTFSCLPNYTASPPERFPVCPIIKHPLQNVYLSAQLYSITFLNIIFLLY